MIKSRKNSWSIRVAVLVILFTGIAGCGPSQEKIDFAQGVCEEFIQDKFERDTHVFDSWVKDGKLVFEIGYRKKYSSDSSYSVRLCVYDEEKGSIMSPSPFNTSEWKK